MVDSGKLAVVAFVLISIFSAAAVQAAEPVNLLSNGGFEDGLSGWTPDPKHSLVTDPAEAHSGTACLTGSLTEPRKALYLRRDVKVTKGNLYRLGIWARGTAGSKIVLWANQPESTRRQRIADWTKFPRKWRRYTAEIKATADGLLKLEFIIPSSYEAAAGQVWVDDITLHEIELPPVLSASNPAEFCDEPAMAAAGDGSVYVAWKTFRDGADAIDVSRFKRDGKTLRRQGSWQIAGGAGTYVLGIRAVGAPESVVVVYAAERNKNWDIYAVSCSPSGPAEPVALTSHAAVDVKPTAAWFDGTLWFAWESNRNGPREVFVASMCDGVVSKPVSLSPADTSSYGPSLAVLASGRVCVAWHSFVGGNYDIYLRRTTADGSWSPQRRLTEAPTIDRHPLLIARGDELWCVYENAQTEKYNVCRTNDRRLHVVKVTAEGLLSPKSDPENFPPAARREAPAAMFDPSGRLWLSYRAPRLPRSGWDVFLVCLADGRWQPPVQLTIDKGMDRNSPIAVVDGRVVVALQADELPNTWSEVDATMQATSGIYLVDVGIESAPVASAIPLEPLVERPDEFEPAAIRGARGEDTPTPSISYQGRTLNLYFGDLHEHTDVSVCNRLGDQSVDESYQHMRDLARHDFACATDHGYNINPYLWSYLAEQVRVNDDPGRFLTFLAEEWTSSIEEYSAEHPYGFYGHRNLILADPYFPRWFNSRNRQTPADLWEELRRMNANFVQIPHQVADTGNVPTDWNFTDEAAQPVAEIFQTRGSYEYKNAPREATRSTPRAGYFLHDAWARGIVIGVIASPDHGGGYGKACVYAPELTREAILDAIRRRHCYGTTAAKILLDVRVDGHLMGEKVAAPAGDSVEVKISVRCPAEIDRIEVCRNNRFIYANSPDGTSSELTFTDRKPLDGRSYYYVRVIQADEEIAWSSPVWFGAE